MKQYTQLNLIKSAWTTDALGQRIPVETVRTVLGRISSVTRSEWNAAMQNGLSPDYTVEMYLGDYQKEEIAEIADKTIEETFSGDGLTASFTLAEIPAGILSVTVGGQPEMAYMSSGRVITLETAPQDQEQVVVRYLTTQRYSIYRAYIRDINTIELQLGRRAGTADE